MRHKHLGAILALTILAVAVGCNAGGSSSTTPPSPAPAPATGPFTVVSGGSTFLDLPAVGNTTASALTLPAPTSGGGTKGTFTVSTTNPVSTALLGDKRPASVAGANGLWYLTLTFAGNVTIPSLPAMQVEFATAQPTTVVYWSAIDPAPSGGWVEPWSGPGTVSNGGLTIQIPAKAATPYTFLANTTYVIAIYSSPATPTPSPSPTPTPSPTPATPTPTPTPNAIGNPGFESSSSSFAPWYACYAGHPTLSAAIDPNPAIESPQPTFTQSPTTALIATPSPDDATIVQSLPGVSPYTQVHSGSNAGLVSRIAAPRTKGLLGICQDVTVPATGSPTLSLWVWEGGNVNAFPNYDSEVDVFSGATWSAVTGGPTGAKSSTSNPTATLFAETNCFNNQNTSGGSSSGGTCATPAPAAQPAAHGGQWRRKGPYDMTPYAGQTVTILLGVWSGSSSANYYDYAAFDDVLLTHS